MWPQASNQTGREKSVHSGGVSTVVGCPQGEVLLYLPTYMGVNFDLSPPSNGTMDSVACGTHYSLQEPYMHSSYM